MNQRDFAALSCRILALVTLVAYLHVIVSSLGALVLGAWDVLSNAFSIFPDAGHFVFGVGSLVIPGVMYLVVSWLLWAKADWIAAKLIPNPEAAIVWPNVRLEDLQVLAFTVLGLIALLNAVRYLTGSLSSVFRGYVMTFHDWITSQETLSSFASLLLGALLLLGSRGFIRFIQYLRVVGRGSLPENEPYDPVREA